MDLRLEHFILTASWQAVLDGAFEKALLPGSLGIVRYFDLANLLSCQGKLNSWGIQFDLLHVVEVFLFPVH